jgi:hypothetical protein
LDHHKPSNFWAAWGSPQRKLNAIAPGKGLENRRKTTDLLVTKNSGAHFFAHDTWEDYWSYWHGPRVGRPTHRILKLDHTQKPGMTIQTNYTAPPRIDIIDLNGIWCCLPWVQTSPTRASMKEGFPSKNSTTLTSTGDIIILQTSQRLQDRGNGSSSLKL